MCVSADNLLVQVKSVMNTRTKKERPFWASLFWCKRQIDSNRFNATVRWTVACRRFYGGNSVRGEAEAIESCHPGKAPFGVPFSGADGGLEPIHPGKRTNPVVAVGAGYWGRLKSLPYIVGIGY